MFAFGRRRLRQAHFPALGNEFSERAGADDGARPPHADLRIDCGLRDRVAAVAAGRAADCAATPSSRGEFARRESYGREKCEEAKRGGKCATSKSPAGSPSKLWAGRRYRSIARRWSFRGVFGVDWGGEIFGGIYSHQSAVVF